MQMLPATSFPNAASFATTFPASSFPNVTMGSQPHVWPPMQAAPLATASASPIIGVDTNHDGHANYFVSGYPNYANASAQAYPTYGQVGGTRLSSYGAVQEAPMALGAQLRGYPNMATMAQGAYSRPYGSVTTLPSSYSTYAAPITTDTALSAHHTYHKELASQIQERVEKEKSAPSEGIVGKAEDAVLGVVHGVVDAVHNVEDKVEGAVHAVEDKVSGWFGSIGSLFGMGGGAKTCPKSGKLVKAEEDHAGPAGKTLGVGSSVEVHQSSGPSLKGHIVKMPGADGFFEVQCHQDARGSTLRVPQALVKALSSFHPVVGSGVEALHEGIWYSAHILAVPADDPDKLGRWTAKCHDDPEGIVTYCDETNIRPLLSPEERTVVKGAAYQEKAAAKEASRAKRKQQKLDDQATQAKAAEEDRQAKLQEVADFKQKFADNGLQTFYPIFLEHGYDTSESINDVHDEDLRSFGLKGGHITKFHAAFPRGSAYIVDNPALKALYPSGLGYRPSRSMDVASHTTAAWGCTVVGIDQHDGWLKVGMRYLPMLLKSDYTMYLESEGPPKPKNAVQKAEAAVEGAVGGAMHAIGGFLHLSGGAPEEAGGDAPATTKPAACMAGVMAAEHAVADAAGSALHGVEAMFGMGGGAAPAAVADAAPAADAPTDASAAKDGAPAPAGALASAEAAAMEAEGAVAGALGGIATRMHLW